MWIIQLKTIRQFFVVAWICKQISGLDFAGTQPSQNHKENSYKKKVQSSRGMQQILDKTSPVKHPEVYYSFLTEEETLSLLELWWVKWSKPIRNQYLSLSSQSESLKLTPGQTWVRPPQRWVKILLSQSNGYNQRPMRQNSSGLPLIWLICCGLNSQWPPTAWNLKLMTGLLPYRMTQFSRFKTLTWTFTQFLS